MRKKGHFLAAILLVGIIAFAAFLSNTDRITRKGPIIEGVSEEQHVRDTVRKPLYIGFIPQGNAVFMVRKWQPLADYLAKELGMPVEMVFRSSYRDIITAFSNGEVDICLTGAFMYVLTRENADIHPLVRRKKFGSSRYYSVIVVRKDSGIRRLADLKGKSFVFTDKESTTGYLLPMAMMRQKGILDPEQYFSEVIYTGNHDSALLAVFMQRMQAAAMSSTRWHPENPQIKELTIIWQSEPIFLGPFSVRAGLDEELEDRIKKAFLRIGNTADTKELSEHIQIEGFEEARDHDYDSIRRVKEWIF